MFLRELIETTVKPIMQNGRKVYKHDYSDSVFPSEKVARDDERMKKPVTTQKLRTFGGKSSDVQQSKNMDIDQMKEQFYTISEGGYANLLFDLFGKERVEKELVEFFDLDFIPRFGGGIGVTRLISGMRKANLI